ncbi:MAG: hypothetical protein ACOCQD_05210 [archaeon]
MKMRSGFVSNSSSSSFMAIVRSIVPEDIKDENKDRIRIYSHREYGEGYPYWTPSEEELETMRETENTEPFILVEELLSAEDGDTLKMKKDMLPTIAKIALNDGEDFQIMVFDKSYHQPDDIRSFIGED